MNGSEYATPVDDSVGEVAAKLHDADRVLVGLDFDGTLAPIHDDHRAPEITPDCRAAVESLASAPNATVAVVSGRELSDLKPRVGVTGIVYAGNHGLEIERDGTEVVHPIAADRRSVVRSAVRSIADRVGDLPGVELEDKGLTASVHYRNVTPERVREVRSAVDAVVGVEHDRLEVREGKEVLEVRTAVDWDKGSAVQYVAGHLEGDPVPVYVGDDVTDEDAFRVVSDGGVAVVVGNREATDADYRLESRDDVAPFLDWMAATLSSRRADE